MEACGDLALALALNRPALQADPPTLAMNVSVPYREDDPVDASALTEVLARVARR